MAIHARLLALAVVLTLASALDKWGLFGCPDFKKQTGNIPYTDLPKILDYFMMIGSRSPFRVIAGAESEDAAAYSCVTYTAQESIDNVGYTKSGTKGSATLTLDMTKYQLKGTLPKGLLGVPDDTKETIWTIVNDKDGFVVMKTCRSAFLSHFTSTYILVDKDTNATSLDMAAIIPEINKTYKIKALAKCSKW